jgi:hypothetical protein
VVIFSKVKKKKKKSPANLIKNRDISTAHFHLRFHAAKDFEDATKQNICQDQLVYKDTLPQLSHSNPIGTII